MITKILINLIFFLGLTHYLTALPATLQVHAAENWFKLLEKYGKKEKQEFILGMLFHDRELIEKIPTDAGKLDSIELSKIYLIPNPFEAGLNFSIYVRKKREKILKKWGVEEIISGVSKDKIFFFLQLLEDEIMYAPLLCGKASSYLSGISEGEILSGIQVEKLAIWHGIMYKYFSQKPSNFVLTLAKDKRIKFSFTEAQGELWRAALLIYATHQKIQEYLEDLITEFDSDMELFKLKYLKKSD
jgi:hypothetical protein